MTSRGNLVEDCATGTNAKCTVSKSNRIRAWEGYTLDWDRWSGEVAVIYDDFNSGADANSHIRWTSVGVRPMYWFTDHFSLAAEAGVSNVNDESDGHGSRNLVRTTIAPQLSLGKGYESRPVIRAFWTRNSWNDNNKGVVTAKTTSSADDTEASNFGVQTEIWF
jgi:maltoporin